MDEHQPPAQEGQIARAQKLREWIQRLKDRGAKKNSQGDPPAKSLKEQIDKRAAEQQTPGDRE